MTRQRLNTVARVGARTLIVAGFAGGVWLLSAAAAHAAAPAGATTARTDQTVVDLTTRVTDPAIRLVDQVLAPSSTVPGHRMARGRVPVRTPFPGCSRPCPTCSDPTCSGRCAVRLNWSPHRSPVTWPRSPPACAPRWPR